MSAPYDRLGAAAVGVLAGSALVPFLPTSLVTITVVLVVGTVFLLGWLLPLDRRILLAALAATLTAGWGWLTVQLAPSLDGSPIALTGTVASLPERTERSTHLRLTVTESPQPTLVGRQLELVVSGGTAPRPAQRLSCVCRAVALDPPRVRRLLALGMSAQVRVEELELRPLDRHPRWWLLRLREAFVATADRIWPLPESSLAAGLSVGSREAFAPAFTEAMQRTGTTHLVAVSGQNVAIVLYLIATVLPVRRPWRRFGVLSGILLAFTVLTGGSASVVRAGVMAWVLALASVVGRPVGSLRLLVIVAAAMVLWHPLIATSDLGFQLSFVAVLSLIALAPRLAGSIPGPPLVRTAIAATLAAYLATAPLIASTFGTVSLVAPLANLAVAALVLPAMVLALGTVVLGTLIPPIAASLGWLSWPVLAAITWLIEQAARVPTASVQLKLSPWWSVAVLVELIALSLRSRRAMQQELA